MSEKFHPMDPQMLSTRVTFDIENETRVVRPSLSPAIAAFLDKPVESQFASSGLENAGRLLSSGKMIYDILRHGQCVLFVDPVIYLFFILTYVWMYLDRSN